MAMQSINYIPGYARDLPLQCYDLAANKMVFQASDTLAAGVRMAATSSDLFAPTINWNTRGGLQTGYDQGQVLVSISGAQAQGFQPSKSYTLTVVRTLGSDNTKTEPIARMMFVIEPIA